MKRAESVVLPTLGVPGCTEILTSFTPPGPRVWFGELAGTEAPDDRRPKGSAQAELTPFLNWVSLPQNAV